MSHPEEQHSYGGAAASWTHYNSPTPSSTYSLTPVHTPVFSPPFNRANSVIAHTPSNQQQDNPPPSPQKDVIWPYDSYEDPPQQILKPEPSFFYPQSLFPHSRFVHHDSNCSPQDNYPSAHQNLSDFLSPIGPHHFPLEQHFIMPSHNHHQFINQFNAFNGKTSLKNRGGRRPKDDDSSMDPQDAEKRRLRRVRNKEAAARCRQRRIDLMNQLQDQVNVLETELGSKKDEVERLKEEKSRLECMLRNHQCKIDGLNGFPPVSANSGNNSHKMKPYNPNPSFRAPKIDPEQTLTQVVTESLRDHKMELGPPHTSAAATTLDRPFSLNLGSGLTPTTPSGGLFGDLMGLPTGLTPVNSTGYTPLTSGGGLSLETPTTSMDSESGIISLKNSLCQL